MPFPPRDARLSRFVNRTFRRLNSSYAAMSSPARPIITADVVFLRAEEGGRSLPPVFDGQHTYRPHIVIQGRDVRRSATDADGVNRERYQGVAFLEGPSPYAPGHAGQFALELMYYPDLPYSDVQPGATFTAREGGKIVGHGVVLSRTEPTAA